MKPVSIAVQSPTGDWPAKVWVETGGDTGGGEVYCSPSGTMVGRIDWDEFNTNDGGYGYDADWVFECLSVFGRVMPKATFDELLTRLHRLAVEGEG